MKAQQKRLQDILKSKKPSRFEKKVLMAVSKIPRGQVRSYEWVADRIGSPGASRAVGQALMKNPLPFIIPCHRVIKAGGELGGFMFGKKMKEMLLSNEGLTVKKGVVIISEVTTYGAKRT